jgi:hypothetical protein
MFPVPPAWLSADDAEAKRRSEDKAEFMAAASVAVPTLYVLCENFQWESNVAKMRDALHGKGSFGLKYNIDCCC